MDWLGDALLVIVLASLWLLRRAAAARRAQQDDREWLPVALQHHQLLWSERTFRCESFVRIVVRIDRAYQGADGQLTLIEFKQRAACRTFASDVVELSVQRYVLQKIGYSVGRRAYVVVVPSSGGRKCSLPVDLEDTVSIEQRMARLLGLREGQLVPEGSAHAAVCRRCGHTDLCPRRL